MPQSAIVFIAADSKLRFHVGTCSNVAERMHDLKTEGKPCVGSFDRLVWVAKPNHAYAALEHERRLRRSSYDKLVAMISQENPELRDLSATS